MGAAVDSTFLTQAPYATTLAREYSALEPSNEMKFDSIHPKMESYDFADADAQVAFAQTHGMKVRGHNLVWHHSLPDWISAKDWMHAQNGPSAPWTPEALNKVLAEHIATVVGRYRGKVYAWDVVNEPFNDDGSLHSSIWYEKPGIGFAGEGTKYIEQALIWAHAADPEAKLFVNEAGAEIVNKKSDAVYAMAKDFRKRGVPLHGIGLQLHVGYDFNSYDSLRRNIHRLAELGLEVHFTEVDVRLTDSSAFSLRAEADIYKSLLDACLKEPACTLFQSWGFTDKNSWIPAAFPGSGWALPFDENYQKKPAYHAMLKKLQSQDNVESRPRASRESHPDFISQYRTLLDRRGRMGE
jgi:endo-1,4-beta-xylanase